MSTSTANRRSPGVVTFLDVLGWKGIYGREGDPIQDLEKIVGDLEMSADTMSRGLGTSELTTDTFSVSDTIVFITPAEGADVRTAVELHAKLSRQALVQGLRRGLPMRGATAWGDVGSGRKGTIFVGRAVDEAAAWHELADWIGVLLAPSALYATAGMDLNEWREYSPPLKGGKTFQTRCLVWTPEPTELQQQFVRMSPIMPEVVSKFENTTAYAKECAKETETAEAEDEE